MFSPEQLIHWSTVGAGLFMLIYTILVLTSPIEVFRERVQDDASLRKKLKAFPEFYWHEIKRMDLYFAAKILSIFVSVGFVLGGLLFTLFAGIMVIFT